MTLKSSELGMIADEKPFHIRFMERKISELEEYRKKGDPYIEVTVDSLQALALENLHLHYRIDHLEKRLADGYNMYCWTQWPAKQTVLPSPRVPAC
jgi:hypothetical protein